jgi:replicative DNA helicase
MNQLRKLSEEDQRKLDLLESPEPAEKQDKFTWEDDFQRRLLALLLTDRYFLLQSINKIDCKYFTSETHVLVAKCLFEYFENYAAMPEPFILIELFNKEIVEKTPELQMVMVAELKSLYNYYVPEVESRDFLLDRIRDFAKKQSLKIAFSKCTGMLKAVNQNKNEDVWTEIYDELKKAMLVQEDHEPGLEFFKTPEQLFDLMKEQLDTKERFTTGFPSIDNAITGGGLGRGEIGAWIGLPGSGKSLVLIRAAVENVRLNKKVLYISLEMDELGIGTRFVGQFTDHNINKLLDKKQEILEHVEEFKKERDDGNLLIIKRFPGGSIDVNGIKAYHNQLVLSGFKPDLLIVDYIGEMKDNPNLERWESRYQMIRDLRSFGIEEDHCTLTAVQPNSSASKLDSVNQYIDESNIGASFDQFKPLDAFWSINQLVMEKDASVARGFVIKHRNGKSRFPFYIRYDYDGGTLNTMEIDKKDYVISMNKVAQRKQSAEIMEDTVIGFEEKSEKPSKRKKDID